MTTQNYDNEKMATLLSQLIRLVDEHGWKTEPVREFVNQHKNVDDFYELAKTILVIKAQQADGKTLKEVLESIFSSAEEEVPNKLVVANHIYSYEQQEEGAPLVPVMNISPSQGELSQKYKRKAFIWMILAIILGVLIAGRMVFAAENKRGGYEECPKCHIRVSYSQICKRCHNCIKKCCLLLGGE